jgi:hypothetical protein
MRNPSLTTFTLHFIAAGAAVIALAVAAVPLSVLVLHGQAIDIAVYAGLRALWAFLIVCSAVGVLVLLAILASALIAGLIDLARGHGRLGR